MSCHVLLRSETAETLCPPLEEYCNSPQLSGQLARILSLCLSINDNLMPAMVLLPYPEDKLLYPPTWVTLTRSK